jgi:hypothetical protein
MTAIGRRAFLAGGIVGVLVAAGRVAATDKPTVTVHKSPT